MPHEDVVAVYDVLQARSDYSFACRGHLQAVCTHTMKQEFRPAELKDCGPLGRDQSCRFWVLSSFCVPFG